MRPEIVSRESQPDNQPLVAKNALLITKDRVRKLRMEPSECLGLVLARLDQGDMNGVVGVARPYSRGRSQSALFLVSKQGKEGPNTYSLPRSTF